MQAEKHRYINCFSNILYLKTEISWPLTRVFSYEILRLFFVIASNTIFKIQLVYLYHFILINETFYFHFQMEVLSSASGPSRTDRTMSNSSSCSMDSTTKKTSLAKISKAASASAASANTSRWCSKTTLTTNICPFFKLPSTYLELWYNIFLKVKLLMPHEIKRS